ncbi:MAG: hypothetical protein ACRDQX_08755 [Pseudonocardiaceae bacterium]
MARQAGRHGTTRLGGALARHRDFRMLFAGNSVSLLGSSVTMVALLPHLVLGPPAGVWVDRIPYRRILVLADTAQMLLLGSVPIMAACGLLRMWHRSAVVTLAGVANLFETMTAQSFTPLLVSRDELFPANSVLMMIFFLISGLRTARIHHPGQAAESTAPRALHPQADIVEGLRAVFSDRIIRAVILAATVGAFADQRQAALPGQRHRALPRIQRTVTRRPARAQGHAGHQRLHDARVGLFKSA